MNSELKAWFNNDVDNDVNNDVNDDAGNDANNVIHDNNEVW